MEFHKWPKIENIETERLRNSRAFQKAQTVENWVVTEKIDGTNIAVNIDHEGFRLSSRNQFVGSDFYGVSTALHQVEPLVEMVQKTLAPELLQFTLQGEFFGTKVMGRVNYRLPQAFRFFGAYSVHRDRGYERWPWQLFVAVMQEAGYDFMIVPVIGHYKTFGEAASVEKERASCFNPDARAEGIVIQPMDMPIEPDGLIFKNKSETFKENRLPSMKPTDADRAVIDRLNAEFRGYVNEARVLSAITKIGRPKSITDFKPYASEIFSDAWADFVADHPGLELTGGDVKAVRNVGSHAYWTFQQTYQKHFKE
jgi:hypothetical protein